MPHLNAWGFDISAAEFPQQNKTRVFGVNRPLDVRILPVNNSTIHHWLTKSNTVRNVNSTSCTTAIHLVLGFPELELIGINNNMLMCPISKIDVFVFVLGDDERRVSTGTYQLVKEDQERRINIISFKIRNGKINRLGRETPWICYMYIKEQKHNRNIYSILEIITRLHWDKYSGNS